MRPNEEFYSLMDPKQYWDSYCPSCPTPDMWYLDGQQQNITTNYCSDGSGSFTTTIFQVFLPETFKTVGGDKSYASSIYSYNPVPGSVGPGSGGNYNIGQYAVGMGNYPDNTNMEVKVSYNYTGTYPSETVPGHKATGTYSSSEKSLVISQQVMNSTPNVSYARINGRTMSTSSSGGIALIGCVTSNKSTLTTLATPGFPAGGGQKETIIYFSTLSAGDRAAVESCLKSKYGISY